MKRGRKPLKIFDGVDLSRPAQELMDELGCTRSQIYAYRRKRGIRYTRKLNMPPDVDFTRPAIHIAKELGIPYSTLLAYMRRNGITVHCPGYSNGHQKPYGRHTEMNLPWAMRDSDLCGPNNCTREYIRQLRKRAGEPASGSKEWADKYHPVKTSQPRDT